MPYRISLVILHNNRPGEVAYVDEVLYCTSDAEAKRLIEELQQKSKAQELKRKVLLAKESYFQERFV